MILIFEIDGTEKQVDVPLAMSEIKFSDFVDFRHLEAKYWGLVDQGDDTAVNALIDALKCIVKGDAESIPFALEGDDYGQLVDDNFQMRIGEQISMLRIYAHLTVLINTFTPEQIPERFKWSWRGQKYVIEAKPAARLLAGKPLTTGEALEVLEYQRRAGMMAELTPHDEGNIDFTLGLTEVSILLRKKGEKLPSERKELDRFLNARRKIFENITLDRLVEMRFFLLNALLQLRKTQTINSSGRGLQVRGLSKSQRLRKSAKRLQKRLGKSLAGVSFTKSE